MLLSEGAQVATTVTARGSFCVTFKPTNRAGKQVSKPCLFSLCLALVFSLKLSSKKKTKKQKFRCWPPANVALPAIAATRHELKQHRSVVAAPIAIVPQQRKLQQCCRDACCNSAAALSRHMLQQRRNAAATRAATSRACSAVATRACTAAAPRCHRHCHKAHGRTAAW